MPNVDEDDYERPSRTANVKRRVAAPAILLLLSAILSLLISGTMLAMAVMKPFVFADAFKNYIDAMPNGVMKEDMSKQFDSTKESMALNSPLNLSYYILTLLAGIVMVYGAWQMKTVGSYRWAMAGALVAFIPLSGCSIFAFPFGLYAIIRLGANDVVKGFLEARKARHAH